MLVEKANKQGDCQSTAHIPWRIHLFVMTWSFAYVGQTLTTLSLFISTHTVHNFLLKPVMCRVYRLYVTCQWYVMSLTMSDQLFPNTVLSNKSYVKTPKSQTSYYSKYVRMFERYCTCSMRAVPLLWHRLASFCSEEANKPLT